MKKFFKVLIITLLSIASLYLIGCIIMWYKFTNLLPTNKSVYITDSTLAYESTYEISEGNITMQIPTYYTSTNMRDYSAMLCHAKEKNRELIIFYDHFNYVADKLIPGFSNKYLSMIGKYQTADPEFPFNLFFDVSDDFFDVLKSTLLADRNDYNFWNLKSSMELYYYLKLREHTLETNLNICYLYERDEIRAFVNKNLDTPNMYIVMIIPNNNLRNPYCFSVQTPDPEDVIKLLNTFEFKR